MTREGAHADLVLFDPATVADHATIEDPGAFAELIQPEGAVVLIGDSEKESEAQRQCRSNLVRNNPEVDVVSSRRVINGLESDARSRSVK